MFPKYISSGNDPKRFNCFIKVSENENEAYYWLPGGCWGIGVDKDLISKHSMEHLNNKQCYPCTIIDFIISSGSYVLEEQYYGSYTDAYDSFMNDIKIIEDLFKNE